MKKLRVTIEGKSYEVLVEVLDETSIGGAVTAAVTSPTSFPSAPAPGSAAAPPAPAAVSLPGEGASASEGEVPSPLAGKIVSIDVTVGQAVADGVQVATIEAMKMNTYIYASKSGRVSAILVKPGDGVQEGTVLLRIA